MKNKRKELILSLTISIVILFLTSTVIYGLYFYIVKPSYMKINKNKNHKNIEEMIPNNDIIRYTSRKEIDELKKRLNEEIKSEYLNEYTIYENDDYIIDFTPDCVSPDSNFTLNKQYETFINRYKK